MRLGGLLVARSPEAVVSGQPVVLALQKLREDIDLIDEQVGRKPRLGPAEGLTLAASAALAAAGPVIWSEKVVEVLIPGCALLVAAIGVSAEYVGRVATASGMEVAATSMRAAVESETLLATAERSKAVLPFAVGLSAAAAGLALVLPPLLKELSWPFQTELLVVCPAVALGCSAVAALAHLETSAWAEAARILGRRRFSERANAGRLWQSQTASVLGREERDRKRWQALLWAVTPGPLLALGLSGTLAFKAIVASACAAAQAAYFFAKAENDVARATAAVALKGRTAAVAETYASQASRVMALLPFTSSLIGLTAAFAAILVEVQPAASAALPTLGALVAAAAQVSKACCEADAAAAVSAVDTPPPPDDFGTDNRLPFVPGILEFARPILGAAVPAKKEAAA